MKIEIKNYQGLKSAELEATDGGLITITGDTGNGKSSFCAATRCALNSEWKVYPKMTKAEANLVINDNEKIRALTKGSKSVSECTIIHPNFVVTSDWANQKVQGNGPDLTTALPYATGFLNICEIDTKQRSSILSQVLNLNPTREELIKALPAVPEPKVSSVWDDITLLGWDGAKDNLSNHGRALKAKWREITGENYGSEKGQSYYPDGWSPDFKHTAYSDLERDVEVAKSVYITAERAQGVSESEIEKVQDLADTLPEFKIIFGELSDDRIEIAKKVSEIQKQRDAIPTNKPSMSCPKCKESLLVVNGELNTYKKPTKADLEKRENLSNKHSQLLKEASEIDARLSAIRQNIVNAEEAEQKVKTLKRSDSASLKALESSMHDYENAKLRLAAYHKKDQADRIHNEISELALIVKAISPEGVRKDVLFGKLEKFNSLLAKISQNIEVKINEDLNFTINGVPWFFASNGQRQFLQGVVQVAICHITKCSPIVVIDCDKMDDFYYGELKSIGSRAKFVVIIAGFGIPDAQFTIVNDRTGKNGILMKTNEV